MLRTGSDAIFLRAICKDAEMAVEYGIPADKLVLGVPFIGTTGVNGEQVSYSDFINGGLSDVALDEFTYNGKTYTLNGQNTIRKKSEVCL